jgi:hypothetical protein
LLLLSCCCREQYVACSCNGACTCTVLCMMCMQLLLWPVVGRQGLCTCMIVHHMIVRQLCMLAGASCAC